MLISPGVQRLSASAKKRKSKELLDDEVDVLVVKPVENELSKIEEEEKNMYNKDEFEIPTPMKKKKRSPAKKSPKTVIR